MDAERDIFWLGTALQSMLALCNTDGIAKGKSSISEILGEVIATLRRIGISGNLLSQIEEWSNRFRDTYAENEAIRQEDKERFITGCQGWIQGLQDLMKERFAHPKEIYDILPKIDEMHEAIERFQTTEHQFVCTAPDAKQIKEKVTDAIDRSIENDDMLLTGYFDNALVDKLINALRKGVQVRLIVPIYKPNERDNISATRRVKRAGAQVKQHDTNHARLMIIGTKNALISSADPKTDGLDQNYEAGIWTNNRTLIQNCRDFFDVLWAESVDWDM